MATNWDTKIQPQFAIAEVTESGGNMGLKIDGASASVKNIASSKRYNAGSRVLVIYADDNTPIVIGDGGYRSP